MKIIGEWLIEIDEVERKGIKIDEERKMKLIRVVIGGWGSKVGIVEKKSKLRSIERGKSRGKGKNKIVNKGRENVIVGVLKN